MGVALASPWRWLASVLLASSLVGCGGREAPRGTAAAASPPRPAAPTTPAAPAATATPPAPRSRPITLEGAPADAPVEVSYLVFEAPASVLPIAESDDHERLLLVLEHELEVSPLLAGGHDAPVPVAAGGAIRIPAGTPSGEARWSGRGSAEAIFVQVRCGAGLPCAVAPAGSARGQLAALDTTPELVAGGGRLGVHILFPLVAEQATAASLALLEAQPGTVVPRHMHEASAEVLVIERGRGVTHVGDREITVAGPMALYLPPATPHDLTVGDAPLRAWQLYTPSGPELRFRGTPDAGVGPAPARRR